MALAWYRASDDIIHSAPEVTEHVATGRESTRLNPRGKLRKVQIDWSGYSHSVDTILRTQWHISDIASTLVDSADDKDPQPWPSPAFLSIYAGALKDISSAISHFGRNEDGEQHALQDDLDNAMKALDDLEDDVRRSPVAHPRSWPAYGALLIDAKRMVRELRTTHEIASVPTDNGSVRSTLRWPRWT